MAEIRELTDHKRENIVYTRSIWKIGKSNRQNKKYEKVDLYLQYSVHSTFLCNRLNTSIYYNHKHHYRYIIYPVYIQTEGEHKIFISGVKSLRLEDETDTVN